MFRIEFMEGERRCLEWSFPCSDGYKFVQGPFDPLGQIVKLLVIAVDMFEAEKLALVRLAPSRLTSVIEDAPI